MAATAAGSSVPAIPEANAVSWTEPKLAIAEVLQNWGKVWKGDTTPELINHTIAPNVVLETDRLPAGEDIHNLRTTPVVARSAEELLAYIGMSRGGFSSYRFIDNFHFVNSTGSMLVSRWTLVATVGDDNPSPIRKSGDTVTMDGTDIYEFCPVSGRILKLYTAQDTLNYAHQLGFTISC